MRGRENTVLSLGALVGLLLAACAPTSLSVPTLQPLQTAVLATPSVAPSASPTAFAASASGSPSVTASPSPTAVATAKPTAATANVDLTFTGTFAFPAVGTKGRCPAVGTLFTFEGTDADYPGLGQSFSVAQLTSSSAYVDIKWLIEGAEAFALPGPATPGAKLGTVALSADHKTVTLDTDLAEFAKSPRPEHVKGTITCP